MENETEELLKELVIVETMIKENPCRMNHTVMSALREVVHTFIGKNCVEGASRDQVARYLERDVRTITRWQQAYEDFPKPRHDGHKEVSYTWTDVVAWKLAHKDIYERK